MEHDDGSDVSPGIHDLGGRLDEPFAVSEHDYAPWEKRTHALRELLARKQLMSVDELRLAIESQSEDDYRNRSYYEQWITAMSQILIERRVITEAELDRAMQDVIESRPVTERDT